MLSAAEANTASRTLATRSVPSTSFRTVVVKSILLLRRRTSVECCDSLFHYHCGHPGTVGANSGSGCGYCRPDGSAIALPGDMGPCFFCCLPRSGMIGVV